MKYLMGYFSLWQSSVDSEYIGGSNKTLKFIGAILTVDLDGFPLESVHTDPVHVEDAQKIFYGKSLNKYIVTEVIGKNLFTEIENKPSIILVNQPDLLDINRVTDIPVVYFKNDEQRCEGTEDDIKFFNDMPKETFRFELNEPFTRLKEIIESLVNE